MDEYKLKTYTEPTQNPLVNIIASFVRPSLATR
jgi:hypothetical protein